MKKVYVIYRNRENGDAIDHVKRNLETVFENYIKVENCFLNELQADTFLEADAYLVSYEDMLYPLKRHMDNFSKGIIMNRSINRKFLPSILEIPSDTDVLIVNDTYETTIQTTYILYELGIGHLNLIPYDEALERRGAYRNIHTAITPAERDMVPSHIDRVIDIGYREISFDTLLKLMRKLDLDTERINRNLIHHIHSIVEPNTDFHSNYLESYLKGQMLNRVVRNSNSAVLVFNDSYQLIYSNRRADQLFHIENFSSCDVVSRIDKAHLYGEDASNQLIRIDDENYLFEKSTLMLMDETMGYCITLQNEKDLRDLEINLNTHLRKKGLYAKYHFEDIIYRSSAMEHCISTAKQVAVTGYTILIRGESGTGKELFAQSIHNYSSRQNAPFVAVNCAALPETLLESELFGYEGGSFTGAHKNGKPGLFEQAQTGTIFLDEIGDISPNLQSRLLRAIQEKQIMRVGSDKVIDTDIRIIAATNKDLEAEVRRGDFRSDLFYRLNVIPLSIPPLRLRKEDILPLLAHFLKSDFQKVTDEEKNRLLRYDWPGNIRELESAAVYYKTLARFPAHPDLEPDRISAASGTACAGKAPEHIKLCALSIIGARSEAYHGIGRTALAQKLKEENFSIGDGKLRDLLADLASQNLIAIGKGRQGASITAAGRLFLRSADIEK